MSRRHPNHVYNKDRGSIYEQTARHRATLPKPWTTIHHAVVLEVGGGESANWVLGGAFEVTNKAHLMMSLEDYRNHRRWVDAGRYKDVVILRDRRDLLTEIMASPVQLVLIVAAGELPSMEELSAAAGLAVSSTQPHTCGCVTLVSRDGVGAIFDPGGLGRSVAAASPSAVEDMEDTVNNDDLGIGRKPAIPIYKIIIDPLTTGVSKDYRPGRMVMSHDLQCHIDTDPQRFLDALSPNDCLWVPLYRGASSFHQNQHGRGAAEKVPQFRRNLQFAAEAAKKVYRIIVGNAAAETWFWHPDTKGKDNVHVCRFLRETCEELRGFGIEPMYTYAEARKDCYWGKWVVRDTLVDLGVIQYCPMIYEMFRPRDNDREYPPWPYFQKYLEGTRFWAGVDFEQGLRDGNDKLLKVMGFEAGVMGERRDKGFY